MTILYEVRSTSQRLVYPIKLVTADELQFYTGFQSQYGYPEQTAEVIRQQHGTFDLAGHPLYADMLFIDFDDNDNAVHECQQTLVDWHVGFEMWNTGGRGYHFHIPHQPVTSEDIPRWHKQWVKTRFPEADVNIYKTSAVIRLPGTFHAKHPGQHKKLVYTGVGNLLELPAAVAAEGFQPTAGVSEDPETAERVLGNLVTWTIPKSSVGRNNHVFKIASACKDTGRPSDEALDICLMWNRTNSIPPLTYREVENTVTSAYKRSRNSAG